MNNLPDPSWFYYKGYCRQQKGIYNLLHLKHNISIELIIECIEQYVKDRPTLSGDRFNSERKLYSKPKNMEELKKFRLECISYTDGVIDHWRDFLSIVRDITGVDLLK